MAAGALELIAKPQEGRPDALRQWGRRVAQSVRLMAEIPVITRRRVNRTTQLAPRGSPGSVDILGLVASTGGPPALAQLLSGLGNLPVPVLIAQHMAPGFTPGLMRWFSEVSAFKVVHAKHATAVEPGHVYMPPDGKDLEVDREGVIRLVDNRGGHWPSGNRLLLSIAEAYGERAAGVVLTGMGDDGAEGLLAIRKAGGVTFAQDEATCVVFGMPQAAYKMGATKDLLPLELMAPTLRELCESRTPPRLDRLTPPR
jgi:two-component system chemotaxis response regulator CheB